MTTQPEQPHGAPSEDEDDHDLLTYGIAGDRLRDEIAVEEAALTTALQEAGPESASAEKARARIEQLTLALQRQIDARANEINEKQFFGEHFSSEQGS